ncbi:MAG: mycofactocin precursor [Deltaproteobacteria bacterium]|jgi:mycofactocin precursor|nr:mycofactocin precursor [Deltaproteobacteria bacterium]
MDKFDVKKDETPKDQNEPIADQSEDSIFYIEEIRIEELAVDGICGVY